MLELLNVIAAGTYSDHSSLKDNVRKVGRSVVSRTSCFISPRW